MLNNSKSDQWQHPKELLKIQKLKFKKHALQKRINGSLSLSEPKNKSPTQTTVLEDIFNRNKRKNPFVKETVESKKSKVSDNIISESEDQTLFKLLNQSASNIEDTSITNFSDILKKANISETKQNNVTVVGSPWCPIDWSLKRKIRLISQKTFAWSQKLKISEEASGITSFARCLDIDQCDTSLDASPNAKFHQCCLYWQQPSLPWLTLFPRNSVKNINGLNLTSNSNVKHTLYETWTDSLKSLYQLIRTRQCPYFYVCANNFTALFRAAGIFGLVDLNVMITPTTRGFRHLLKEEGIEFKLPLTLLPDLESSEADELEEEKSSPELQDKCVADNDDDVLNEDWLKNLGINADDIKNINYTQARIKHRTECQVDSSDQSLILIEGIEVNSFFNFLLNCKSAVSNVGPLAGVPPTLLAPVSFHGATLNALKVRENKINSDGVDYFSLELTGPILPSTIHNIFNINSPTHSITVTFSDIESTRGFSKVKKRPKHCDSEEKGTAIFSKVNLSDCGLNPKVLKHFCSADLKVVSNVECLKYSGDSQSFTWT